MTSNKAITTLGVIILGFYMGIDGEVDFSLFGTAAGVLASLFVALNGIYTSAALKAVGDNKSILMFYNNVNACILFFPLILIFEWKVLVANSEILKSFIFWVCMTICGIFGFGIGLVTTMQIQATSPLTHNVSGTAKAAAQSLLAFYIWGNKATFKGVLGIFLTLIGSSLYTIVQMQDNNSQGKK
jgi:GDP-fucose transporter C1